MRSLLRTGLRSRWPFSLLMLAWFCASYPLAVLETASWLGEARTFSHQQRITREIARVIAEAETQSTVANLAAPSPASSPVEPALPLSVALKKTELANEDSAEAIVFAVPASRLRVSEFAIESAMRGPPPHEPPRVVG